MFLCKNIYFWLSIQLFLFLRLTSHQVHDKNIETGTVDQLTAYNGTGEPFIVWKTPTQIHTLAQYLMSANTDTPVWFLQQ